MRMRTNLLKKMLSLASLAAIIACFAGGQRADLKIGNSLDDAIQNPAEWVTYGRDYAETRFSPLDQINANNVKQLGLAWSWLTESPAGGRVEATPLVSNGVIYGSLAWGVLFALDARTGALKWRWDPEISRKIYAEKCCGPSNRGVALYNGKVYAGLFDGRLVALDQQTGKVLWQVNTAENQDIVQSAAVRVIKGKVIVGNSGAEHAARGYFSAYDAETGKRLWRFYTVPGDPSKPFEHPELAMAAKTWKGEWWKMGGGGTVWDSMAYDRNLDLLYVGTGNGGPWNQNYRSPGGGDNLFLSSIIAVKPDTGRMAWYFQETPGDMWDYTAVQTITLANLNIEGRERKVLLHAPKNGFFYVLDRGTGEYISGQKYVKRLTWAKGLDNNGRPIEAEGARYTNESVLLSPGPLGGHNWQPMSFSPLTGLVYIPGQESSRSYTPDLNFHYKPGQFNTGTTVVNRPRSADGVAVPFQEPADRGKEPEGAENQPPAVGNFLLAWDPVQQKERWRIPGIGSKAGGTLVTAGNIVFNGGTAYNATTGEKTWDAELGSLSGSPITYTLDGQQYITFFSGGHPNNRLFTFSLKGHERIPEGSGKGESEGATNVRTAPAKTDTAEALAEDKGENIVQNACVDCHGLELVFAQHSTKEGWTTIVNDMIANGASLKEDEVSIVVAYLAKNFPPAAAKH
jgi:quinohemoprotein ethanol dehydrogenase